MADSKYQIKQEDGKYCVYNLATDKKVAEFDTRAQAMAKMKDLYKKPAKETANDAEDAAKGEMEDD